MVSDEQRSDRVGFDQEQDEMAHGLPSSRSLRIVERHARFAPTALTCLGAYHHESLLSTRVLLLPGRLGSGRFPAPDGG